MTTTTDRRSGVLAPPATGRLTPARRRRSYPLVAMGSVLIVVATVLAVSAYAALDHRTPAVVTARPVAAGTTLTRDDLRLERVNVGPGVHVVTPDQLDALVGQRAAADLPAGVLLAPGLARGDDQLGSSRALVAIPADRAELPPSLRSGDSVLLVDTTSTDETNALAVARIDNITTDDDDVASTGRVVLTLLVDRSAAPAILTLAAADHLAVAKVAVQP